MLIYFYININVNIFLFIIYSIFSAFRRKYMIGTYNLWSAGLRGPGPQIGSLCLELYSNNNMVICCVMWGETGGAIKHSAPHRSKCISNSPESNSRLWLRLHYEVTTRKFLEINNIFPPDVTAH